jgi:hypothetical protein
MIFENCHFITDQNSCVEPHFVQWEYEDYPAYDDGYDTHIYLYDCEVDCGDTPMNDNLTIAQVHSIGTKWVGVDNILDLHYHDILKGGDRATLDHVHGSSGSSGGYDENALHDNESGEINMVAQKNSPVGADILLIEDSEASWVKKKVQISDLPSSGSSGSGGGASEFTDLTDTPSGYSSKGGNIVAVNSGETGLEFVAPPPDLDIGIVNGRLTLESGAPIPTTNQSGKTTLYFTPFRGNRIAIYTNGAWELQTFTEISLSLSGLTASTPYDIWVYDNSGTLTLDKTAWTNGTTRATALALQDGVYIKSGDATRRYLGTIYINSTGGQTEDTVSQRFVYNYYNRARRHMYKADTNSHAYTTASWRAWNNTTNARIEFIIGVQEESMMASLTARTRTTSAATRIISLYLDNTNNGHSQFDCRYYPSSGDDSVNDSTGGHINAAPGYHFIQCTEYGGTGTTNEVAYITGMVKM